MIQDGFHVTCGVDNNFQSCDRQVFAKNVIKDSRAFIVVVR